MAATSLLARRCRHRKISSRHPAASLRSLVTNEATATAKKKSKKKNHTNVAIVYGSFCHDESLFDAQHIAQVLRGKCNGSSDDFLSVSQPEDGDSFDMDSLIDRNNTGEVSAATASTAETGPLAKTAGAPTMLVVSTSSWNGYPPANLVNFSHQLKLASVTNPGCLSHLTHAVWGNGDERWWGTYMNVPRYVDLLLEKCGSRRVYARGERGEPFAPSDILRCTVEDWADGLAEVVAGVNTEEEEEEVKTVSWDALWSDDTPSLRHQEVIQFDIESMLRATKGSDLPGGVSPLCRPDKSAEHYRIGCQELERHGELLLQLRHEEDERKRRFRERLAARQAREK